MAKKYIVRFPSAAAAKQFKARNRRRYTKKKPAASRLSLIRRTIGNPKGMGVPETMIVKMAYQYTPVAITSAVTPYDSINWSINNLVDVDPAVGGVQPPLFDNFMALYTRFRVVKVKFSFDYSSGTGQYQRVYLAYLGESTTDISNYLTYNGAAGGNYTSKLVGNTSCSNGCGTISAVYDLSKLVGSEMTDGNYYGGPSTAPATILNAQIGVQNLSAGATTCFLNVTPRIEFWVEFNDLKAEAVTND